MNHPTAPRFDESDVDQSASPPELISNLGALIRQERKKRGLTLVQVSTRAHISPAFLSLVERNKGTPSLGSLAGIATALDLPVSSFLSTGLHADAVTRAGQRPRFTIGHAILGYERLSTVFPGQQIDAVIIHVPPGYRAETISHIGEEWIYVLTGELHQSIDGKTVKLGPGDTVHFRGDSPHYYANRGTQPTALIWVGTVPVFNAGERPREFHP